MTSIIRTMTFRANNLGEASTLILTFDDTATPDIYTKVFPTAFRVSAFAATGPYVFTVTYKSDLGFTRAQINAGVVQPASTYTHIGIGDETNLTKTGDPAVYSFSAPSAMTPPTTQMVARNRTDGREDLGFGFFETPGREPSQLLVFKGVGAGSFVQTKFTPILRGYITTGYQANAVLEGQISTHVLFNEDLVQLPQNTDWKITFNQGPGTYLITRET